MKKPHPFAVFLAIFFVCFASFTIFIGATTDNAPEKPTDRPTQAHTDVPPAENTPQSDAAAENSDLPAYCNPLSPFSPLNPTSPLNPISPTYQLLFP